MSRSRAYLPDWLKEKLRDGGTEHLVIGCPPHPQGEAEPVSLEWLAGNGCECAICVDMRSQFGITAKPKERASKPIHETTLLDYRKHIDAWWPKRGK